MRHPTRSALAAVTILTGDQVRLVHAFILDRARKAAAGQKP